MGHVPAGYHFIRFNRRVEDGHQAVCVCPLSRQPYGHKKRAVGLLRLLLRLSIDLLSVRHVGTCLTQLKQNTLIVFNVVPDIYSALLDYRVPLRFQLFFLRRCAARIFFIQLAICLQSPPERSFIIRPLMARPCSNGYKNACCNWLRKIRA